jgi:hypothetical protein
MHSETQRESKTLREVTHGICARLWMESAGNNSDGSTSTCPTPTSRSELMGEPGLASTTYLAAPEGRMWRIYCARYSNIKVGETSILACQHNRKFRSFPRRAGSRVDRVVHNKKREIFRTRLWPNRAKPNGNNLLPIGRGYL